MNRLRREAFAAFLHAAFESRAAFGRLGAGQEAVSPGSFAFIRFVDDCHKMFR